MNNQDMFQALQGSRVLITGATGLIGSRLALYLQSLHLGVSISLLVRNKAKAIDIFKENNPDFSIIECDLVNYLTKMADSYDYIFHCASPTSGAYMSEHPVETYNLAYLSTFAILEYARKSKVRSIVYVSSLEYYGQIMDEMTVTEDVQGYVDMSSPRSCYPLGKRAAEYLCVAYAKEYGIPVKIARLTQTFGPGVAISDNRVFVQFAKSIIKNEDIILHTTGESAKPYCFINDCIDALLCILTRGHDGEAYNVANDETYISIIDLAHYLREHFNPNINVRIELHPEMGYAPITKLKLSSIKLQNLGWKPKYNLYEMFNVLIQWMTKHQAT